MKCLQLSDCCCFRRIHEKKYKLQSTGQCRYIDSGNAGLFSGPQRRKDRRNGSPAAAGGSCINDMEEEAGHIAEAIADADVYVDEEELWDEPEEMPVNVPNGIIKNLLSKNFLDFERSCG